MTQADNKAKCELTVFHKFIQLSGLPVILDSIEHGNPDKREPDILCEIVGQGSMAFELTEFADEVLAREIDRLNKHPEVTEGNFIRLGDVMHILGNKFVKHYDRSRPIDLICYTNVLTALPQNVLIPQMRDYLASIEQHGKFPLGYEKNPRPEFYCKDGQEWMKFMPDPTFSFDGPATDSHKEEYNKEYQLFKAGKQPNHTTRTPNKNQFRSVWFMSIKRGEECWSNGAGLWNSGPRT